MPHGEQRKSTIFPHGSHLPQHPQDPSLLQRANRVISKANFPSAAWLWIFCSLLLLELPAFWLLAAFICCAQFNVSVSSSSILRLQAKDKNQLLVKNNNTNGFIIRWDKITITLDSNFFQLAVWLKRWVLFKDTHLKPWAPRFVYPNFPSHTHQKVNKQNSPASN